MQSVATDTVTTSSVYDDVVVIAPPRDPIYFRVVSRLRVFERILENGKLIREARPETSTPDVRKFDIDNGRVTMY